MLSSENPLRFYHRQNSPYGILEVYMTRPYSSTNETARIDFPTLNLNGDEHPADILATLDDRIMDVLQGNTISNDMRQILSAARTHIGRAIND